MIDKMLQIVAPHYCCGCGLVGSLLCQNCKFNITDEPFDGCLVCGQPSTAGICNNCKTSYSSAWCVAERRDGLERLINDFKFNRAKVAYRDLAELIDQVIPQLPANTVLVPVPTVSAHIRARGYDHTLLIAKQLGHQRRISVQTPLQRQHSKMQRGASKQVRLDQAKTAFGYTKQLSADVAYLLIDDISTTGATLRYAAQALRQAGAETVWVAVIARQPLDK